MDNFYIVLPSNSNEFGRANSFTTNLPEEIIFDGQWECSLSEMNYTTTTNTFNGESIALVGEKIVEKEFEVPEVMNNAHLTEESTYVFSFWEQGEDMHSWMLRDYKPIPKDFIDVRPSETMEKELGKMDVIVDGDDKRRPYNSHGKIFISPPRKNEGLYRSFKSGMTWIERYRREDVKLIKLNTISLKTIQDIVNHLNSCLGDYASVSIFKQKLVIESSYTIRFPDNINYVLGFENTELKPGKHEAEHYPHVMDSMFVYSDIVHHTIVGSSKSQLLRIIPFRGSERNAYESYNMMYVGVMASCIKQISIEIRTDTGKLFPFPDNAKCNIILHFRKSINNI